METEHNQQALQMCGACVIHRENRFGYIVSKRKQIALNGRKK